MISGGRARRRGAPDRLHAALPAGVRRGPAADRGGRDRRADGDQVAHARARAAAAVGVGPRALERHARGGQQPRLRLRPLARGLEIERVYAEVAELQGRASAAWMWPTSTTTPSSRCASRAARSARSTAPAPPTTATTRGWRSSARDGLLVDRRAPRDGRCSRSAIATRGPSSPLHRTWPERFERRLPSEMRAFVETALAPARRPPLTGATGAPRWLRCVAANRSWREGRAGAPAEVAPRARALVYHGAGDLRLEDAAGARPGRARRFRACMRAGSAGRTCGSPRAPTAPIPEARCACPATRSPARVAAVGAGREPGRGHDRVRRAQRRLRALPALPAGRDQPVPDAARPRDHRDGGFATQFVLLAEQLIEQGNVLIALDGGLDRRRRCRSSSRSACVLRGSDGVRHPRGGRGR